MKTLYPLAFALPLLLAGCKKEDCDGSSGGTPSDRPLFRIGFYMTDAPTGQPLIADSLAPYRPDSIQVMSYRGRVIYPRLGYYGGSQYGYVAIPWPLQGSDFRNPAPYNDTAYFYIRLAHNDIDTLKVTRESTGDCKQPWRYTYLFRGESQLFLNYLPGQNTPGSNGGVVNIRKSMP